MMDVILQKDLRRKIQELEASSSDRAERVSAEAEERRRESERAAEERRRESERTAEEYREQVKQHAATIVMLEEELNRVASKNKEYQAEINSLRSSVHSERCCFVCCRSFDWGLAHKCIATRPYS